MPSDGILHWSKSCLFRKLSRKFNLFWLRLSLNWAARFYYFGISFLVTKCCSVAWEGCIRIFCERPVTISFLNATLAEKKGYNNKIVQKDEITHFYFTAIFHFMTRTFILLQIWGFAKAIHPKYVIQKLTSSSETHNGFWLP